MKGVMVGRGDLVRALGSGGPEVQEALAWLLGLEREVPNNKPPQLPPTGLVESQDTVSAGIVPSPPEADAIQVPFWIADSFPSATSMSDRKCLGPELMITIKAVVLMDCPVGQCRSHPWRPMRLFRPCFGGSQRSLTQVGTLIWNRSFHASVEASFSIASRVDGKDGGASRSRSSSIAVGG